jgi:hypothetical protein
MSFSAWIFENGEMVTNVCPSCYYKAVNQREADIQKLVDDTIGTHGINVAIGVYNKLMFPEKDKKNKSK